MHMYGLYRQEKNKRLGKLLQLRLSENIIFFPSVWTIRVKSMPIQQDHGINVCR